MTTPTTTPYPSLLLRTEMPRRNIAAPSYTQATIAVAVFGRHLVTRAGRLENILWNIGDDGSAGTNTFKFRKNGVDISGATFTAASGGGDDEISGIINVGISVVAGDVIDCSVTAAATDGANLTYVPNVSQLF